jgi:hypothetical protein
VDLERIVGTAGQLVAAAIFLLTLVWGGGQLRKKLVGVQDGLIVVFLLTMSSILLTLVVREQSRILGINLWRMILVSGTIVLLSVLIALYMARRRGEVKEQPPDGPKYLFAMTFLANIAAAATIVLCTILLNRAIDAKELSPNQVFFQSPETVFALPSVDAPTVEIIIEGTPSFEHGYDGAAGTMMLEVWSADGSSRFHIGTTQIPAGGRGQTGARPLFTHKFQVAVPTDLRAPGLSSQFRAVFRSCGYMHNETPLPICRFTGTATVRGVH